MTARRKVDSKGTGESRYVESRISGEHKIFADVAVSEAQEPKKSSEPNAWQENKRQRQDMSKNQIFAAEKSYIYIKKIIRVIMTTLQQIYRSWF